MLRRRSNSPASSCSSSSSSDEYYSPIECTSFHNEKLIYKCGISRNIDYLYDLIFGNSEFINNFYRRLNYKDIRNMNWSGIPMENSWKKVTFSVTSPFGFIEVNNHYDLLECSVPNELYSVNIKTKTNGKMGDQFEVHVHNCLEKKTENETLVFVSAKIVFSENIWGIFKPIIENQTWDALENFYKSLFAELLEIPINSRNNRSLTRKSKISSMEQPQSLVRHRNEIRNNESSDDTQSRENNQIRRGSCTSTVKSQNCFNNSGNRSSLLDQPEFYQNFAVGLGFVIMLAITIFSILKR